MTVPGQLRLTENAQAVFWQRVLAGQCICRSPIGGRRSWLALRYRVACGGVSLPTSYPRWYTAVVAFVVLLLIAPAAPASAEPTTPEEGGSQAFESLRGNLAAAAEGYIKAEAEFAASKAKQAQQQERLAVAENDVARVRARIANFAAEAYRTGRITPVGPDAAGHQHGRLHRPRADPRQDQPGRPRPDRRSGEAKARAAQAKAAIDAEVAKQSAAVQEMAKRKPAAEKALAAASAKRANVVDPSGMPVAASRAAQLRRHLAERVVFCRRSDHQRAASRRAPCTRWTRPNGRLHLVRVVFPAR